MHQHKHAALKVDKGFPRLTTCVDVDYICPPTGECWYHIPSPPRQALRQLSVGRTSVFAVDEHSEYH